MGLLGQFLYNYIKVYTGAWGCIYQKVTRPRTCFPGNKVTQVLHIMHESWSRSQGTRGPEFGELHQPLQIVLDWTYQFVLYMKY